MKCHLAPKADRQAVVTAAVVIVLILITAMTAQLARRTVTNRRQTRYLQYQRQASMLAEAALQRAIQQQQQDPNYAGETWNIATGQLHKSYSGSAEITLKDGEIIVVAVYPEQWTPPFQVTRRHLISQQDVPPQTTENDGIQTQ